MKKGEYFSTTVKHSTNVINTEKQISPNLLYTQIIFIRFKTKMACRASSLALHAIFFLKLISSKVQTDAGAGKLRD